MYICYSVICNLTRFKASFNLVNQLRSRLTVSTTSARDPDGFELLNSHSYNHVWMCVCVCFVSKETDSEGERPASSCASTKTVESVFSSSGVEKKLKRRYSEASLTGLNNTCRHHCLYAERLTRPFPNSPVPKINHGCFGTEEVHNRWPQVNGQSAVNNDVNLCLKGYNEWLCQCV